MNVNLLFAIWTNKFWLMNKYLIMKKKIQKFSPIFTIEFSVVAVFDVFEVTAVVELGGAFSWICMSLIFYWITRVCIFHFFINKISMFATKTFLNFWKSNILNCELKTLMLTLFRICALWNLVAIFMIMLMKTLLIQHWYLKTNIMI